MSAAGDNPERNLSFYLIKRERSEQGEISSRLPIASGFGAR